VEVIPKTMRKFSPSNILENNKKFIQLIPHDIEWLIMQFTPSDYPNKVQVFMNDINKSFNKLSIPIKFIECDWKSLFESDLMTNSIYFNSMVEVDSCGCNTIPTEILLDICNLTMYHHIKLFYVCVECKLFNGMDINRNINIDTDTTVILSDKFSKPILTIL
jgi:hypothetical protein